MSVYLLSLIADILLLINITFRCDEYEKELLKATTSYETTRQELDTLKNTNAIYTAQLRRRSDDLAAEMCKNKSLSTTVETLSRRLRNLEQSGEQREVTQAEDTQSLKDKLRRLLKERVEKDDLIEKLNSESATLNHELQQQTSASKGEATVYMVCLCVPTVYNVCSCSCSCMSV
jgi:predicted  nucleic acid-binding Zn-ribbon protein